MSCSFVSDDCPCGASPENVDYTTVIPVTSCTNDISKHLSALGITKVTGRTEETTPVKESDIILSRAGLILWREEDVVKLTVCPLHRYRFTNGWVGRKKFTCFHSKHVGKRKKEMNPRRVNLEMSRSLFELEHEVVPIGAGKLFVPRFWWGFRM